MDATRTINFEALGIPHLSQYRGAWAIDDEFFAGMISHVSHIDLVAHVNSYRAARAAAPVAKGTYTVLDNGVSVIDVQGALTKYGSSFSELPYGTIGLRESLRLANRDERVRAHVLRVDSPGGAVAGTDDFARDVAVSAKPVVVYIEDMGASGAYWIASGAKAIVANPTSVVGSIGVFTVLYDFSGLYAKEGVRAIVVKAGEMKGIGAQGAPITDDQRTEIQNTVTSFHSLFVDAIAAGRKMPREQALTLADGRVYIGERAREMGMIDAIGDMDAAIAEALRLAPEKTKAKLSKPGATSAELKGINMDKATYDELKTALVGVDAAFICAQLDKGATVESAQREWMTELAQRAAKAQADAAEAKAQAATVKQGLEPLPDGKPQKTATAGADGDAIAAWDAALAEYCAKHPGKTKRDAISHLVRTDSDLHKAYLEAYNAKYNTPDR